MSMREVQYSRAPTDARHDSSPSLGGQQTPFSESAPSLAKYAAVDGSQTRLAYSDAPARASAAPSRRKWWIAGAAALLLIAIAVGVGVGVTKSREDSGSSRSGALSPADSQSSSAAARSSSAAAATTSAAPPERPTIGYNGDVIESLGAVYNNSFGGYCSSRMR